MKRYLLLLPLFLVITVINAQKKPLDHSVYDGWQSIGERMVSNDGKWIVYSINPQEGDNELVIQSSDGKFRRSVARGYGATITDDSRYAVFKIRPLFKDTREGRIKKKKPDEMPKDSIAIMELGKEDILKLPRVKSFKTPEKEAGWVAYHLEKPIDKKDQDKSKKPDNSDKKITDSLNRVIDSLHQVIQSLPDKKKKKKNKDDSEDELTSNFADDSGDSPYDGLYAEGDETPPADAGTDLVVRNIYDGKDKVFTNVLEYYFSKQGQKLLIEQAKNPKDSLSQPAVILYDLKDGKRTVLSKGGNDFKNFVFSDDGAQVAYVAERDAKPKELQKFYKLWYFKSGMDSSTVVADRYSVGIRLGSTVSEFGDLRFSKSGKRLFFGTAPIQPPKDTTLVDIDLAKLDVWHYNDDYLQTQQLSRLQRDLQINYLAVYHLDNKSIKQLGSVEIPTILLSNEGDGDVFVGVTDFGRRVASQWEGTTKKDIYAIDPVSGEKKLIKKDLLGTLSAQYISPTGKYIMWYDDKARNYFAWDGHSVSNITSRIKVPLWDEENDSPSDPNPYGIMRWEENDEAVLIYDRYGVWRVDPNGKENPSQLINRRKEKIEFRYVSVDPEERFIRKGQNLVFRSFNENNKEAGLWEAGYTVKPGIDEFKAIHPEAPVSFGGVTRSKNGQTFIYTKENYTDPGDLYIWYAVNQESGAEDAMHLWKTGKLSSINPQQKEYNWGTAELYKWKAFTGKMVEGVLYKPEDFDPNKKYPMILYFYETHSSTLYDYIDPTPTGSRINIPFFVSRGYLVFSPDIHYTIGKPAKSAYDHVVSAAQSLAKQKWVDAKNIGIQGQSWGGIQVAQLVTMTDMFKAAWAGAPVANMTSAYGGIRWESGLNRQFQYEKSQSRIGATLWQKPQLYIENSPLFHLPKVKTPLVIMANDADGAVPWYQGIELFTAMRRLGKKVWMLTYNGEAHNLVERRNKKDIQIREQQYFDWLLKGERPPKWITEGVPAVKKGKDWGLELE